METVFKYNNYRQFLRDYYAEKKRTTGYFTHRYFAQIAGFSSPVFIKLVIDGKANLGKKSIEQICRAMNLSASESSYFENLVWFNQVKSSDKKHHFLQNLRALNEQYEVEVLDTEKYDFYSKWYHSVLREIAPNTNLKDDFAALGELLIPALKKRETKKALKLLQQLQLLQKQEDGSYKQVKKIVSTGSEVESLAIRDLHIQMARLALYALETISKEERDISGLTMGVSRKTVSSIKEEVKNFRERIMRIVAEDENPVDQVYRLNLQFFPLSRLFKKNEEGAHEQ